MIKISANLKPLPDPNQLFSDSQPECFFHSCCQHCLLTLNYCFSSRAQTSNPVLPVRTSLQVLQHNSLWGNLTKTHLHCLFFSYQALQRSNYTVSLIPREKKYVWLMWEQFTRLFKTWIFCRSVLTVWLNIMGRVVQLTSSLKFSIQSAKWQFINAND